MIVSKNDNYTYLKTTLPTMIVFPYSRQRKSRGEVVRAHLGIHGRVHVSLADFLLGVRTGSELSRRHHGAYAGRSGDYQVIVVVLVRDQCSSVIFLVHSVHQTLSTTRRAGD